MELMHRAIESGDVVQLIDCIAEGANIHSRNAEGLLPLHYMDYTHHNILKILLSAGADIKVRNINHQKPLHLAAMANSLQSVQLLLDAGCDGINDEDRFHRRPLYYAILNQSMDIVQLLVDRGAELNSDCFIYAVSTNYSQMVDYLITRGVPLIVNAGEGKDLDILKLVQSISNTERTKLIVKASTSPQEHLETPLNIAIECGTAENVKLLLKYGANVNYQDFFKRSYLHFAAAQNDVEKMKILLECGLNVNHRSVDGYTPITFAAHRNSLDLFEMLLDHGADIIAENVWGESVVNLLAHMSNYAEVLEYLTPFIYKDKKVYAYFMQCSGKDYNIRKAFENIAKRLKGLQSAKFYGDLSLLSILVANKTVLAGYVRNKELVKAFDICKRIHFLYRNCHFYRWINEKFDAAVQRHAWFEPTATFFSEILGFNGPFDLLNIKVMSYLSDYELHEIAKQLPSK